MLNFDKYNIDSLSKEQKENILKKLRKRVDLLDRVLVYLLNRRTKTTVLIGRIKLSLGLPTYTPERERDIMIRINKHNKGPLSEESLERIYERVLDQSRATQKSESPKLFQKQDASGK
jgi:chorismate mutase